MTTSSLAASVVERTEGVSRKLAWLGPLLARITLGVTFLVSGWGKLHNLEKVTGFFTKLGIPAPGFNAHLVASVELIAGALLLVGLATRLAAVPLTITMFVAIATAQQEKLASIAELLGLVEWAYVVLLVWLTLAGSGLVSLDHWLVTRSARERAPRLAV